MRMVNVKGESAVNGGKCTTEKISPRPRTVTLSRQEDHAVGVADDNKGITVISPEQIRTSSIPDLKSLIFDALVTQTETDAYRLCKEKGICEERDGFLYNSSGWMYVPDDNSLCMKVIASHHDSPITSHLGYQKTQELIEHQYYWPGLASVTRSIQKDS